MRLISCVFLFCCLYLSTVSCSNATQPTLSSATIPAINPATTETAPMPVPTPLSAGASLLMRLPRCDGIQTLEEPIIFKWPNIERHIKEYADGLWGYYSCEEPQVDVAAFYRVQMPKPPSNAYEMNWVEISEGTVGVFYNGLLWTIVWIVPQSGNMQKTYVIVAQTSYPVDEVCRLDQFVFNKHVAAGG